VNYSEWPLTRIIDDVAHLCDRLFISQRDHGIDLGGATRGDVARDKRDQCQNGRNSGKNGGVARLHLEKQAGHCAREGQRPNKSNKDADQSEFRCLCHYQSQNIAPLPAESHPYADLMRALAGGIGVIFDNSRIVKEAKRRSRKRLSQDFGYARGPD